MHQYVARIGIILLLWTPFAAEALSTACPAGGVPITSETREKATLAGIPANQPCWEPRDPIVGESVGEAKEYLLSIAKGLKNTKAPPDKAHIGHLNDTLAICAARFLRAYSQKFGPVTISSAYRDGPSGENARAGGVPGSNHTRGMAIDVNPGGAGASYDSMWKFASQNPQFGVCFPRPPYRGSADLPHMILAGIGGNESASCAAQGVTKPCQALNATVSNASFKPGEIGIPPEKPSIDFEPGIIGLPPEKPDLTPEPWDIGTPPEKSIPLPEETNTGILSSFEMDTIGIPPEKPSIPSFFAQLLSQKISANSEFESREDVPPFALNDIVKLVPVSNRQERIEDDTSTSLTPAQPIYAAPETFNPGNPTLPATSTAEKQQNVLAQMLGSMRNALLSGLSFF